MGGRAVKLRAYQVESASEGSLPAVPKKMPKHGCNLRKTFGVCPMRYNVIVHDSLPQGTATEILLTVAFVAEGKYHDAI